MAGCFITFEGGEGVGKSTQARMLADRLREQGREVVLTREPGGTDGAEKIRTLLLDRANDWSPAAESLLFASARADHVDKVIRPALAAGGWVVCDRFLDSSRAYQGGEGGLADADIMALHRIGSGGLLPDLTIILQADPETVAQRLIARDGADSDRIGGRPLAYHYAVAGRFNALTAAESSRIMALDADGSVDDVHARVMEAVGRLNRREFSDGSGA